MYVAVAAVTFNGNSNVMKSNKAPDNQGKNIYSVSDNLKFSVCKPIAAAASGNLIGNLEVDYLGCLAVCTWHDITNDGAAAGTTGTHLVPAAGCKMSKQIDVYGQLTINGEKGSYRELQANKVDTHRHFHLFSGELTLNYLKLTHGLVLILQSGGFIYMEAGTLAINWVHLDGTESGAGFFGHAYNGGCIAVLDGTVTIKESTFDGCIAMNKGGAIYILETSTPMTIASTTFKNNVAKVRFIFT